MNEKCEFCKRTLTPDLSPGWFYYRSEIGATEPVEHIGATEHVACRSCLEENFGHRPEAILEV
jgi:hypothetical protein